jgi:hypothetical protein
LALKLLRGEPVPPAVYIEHTFVRAVQETCDAPKTDGSEVLKESVSYATFAV